MIYNQFKECKLSSLGMGTMRLPVINGVEEDIDVPTTAKMLDYAYNNGVNYYDMAYGYHGQNCEHIIGELLRKYPRDSYYCADKFPGYDDDLAKNVEKVFKTQLERTGMDYFDFYLLHAVSEKSISNYMNADYGIVPFLLKMKEQGVIKHLGFSAHCQCHTLEEFLDAFGEHMEFCQLQINWLDWSMQSAWNKVEILKKRNIPVWVMEPLRGGKLLDISAEDQEYLAGYDKNRSIVEWSFGFLRSVPQITMILSGMSAMSQLEQNVAIFSKDMKLDDYEFKALADLGRKKSTEDSVNCTACHYCTHYCPQELAIPEIIELFNKKNNSKDDESKNRLTLEINDMHPEKCLKCGRCAQVCPQQINIPGVMTVLG